MIPFAPKPPSLFQQLPPNIELCRRTAKNRQVLILINHGKTSEVIHPLVPIRDLLNDTTPTSIKLPAQGVAVLQVNSTQ